MPQTNADNRRWADDAPNADQSHSTHSTAGVAAQGGAPPLSGGPEYDLWLTNRVLAHLGPCRDPDDLLQHLRPLMQELFPHDAGLVATVERDPAGAVVLRLAGAHGLNGHTADLPDPLPPGALIDPWALDDGPLHVPDLEATPLHVADLFAGAGMRSLLSIPLAAGDDGRPAAVLLLAHRAPGGFADVRDASLAQLRRVVAVPLANALHLADHRREREEATASARQLWDLLGADVDPATALPRLLVQALGITRADAGTIMEVVPENAALYVRASRGMRTQSTADAQLPWGSRAVGPAAQLRAPQVLPDLALPGGPPLIAAAAAEGFTTYMGLPVRADGKDALLGLLNLYWRSPPADLSPEREALLENLTRAIAAVLERRGLDARIATCDRVIDQFHAHKTRLQSLMGHQMRTPITSIAGFAQLMLRRAPDPAGPFARYADTILAEARRLTCVVDNVLELSRLEDSLVAMELRAFDLHALLEEIRGDALLQGVTGLGGVTWTLPGSLPIVMGDPLRLKQALIALVRRAHARAPAGAGPIQVAGGVVAHERPPAVELTLGTPVTGTTVTSGEDLMSLIDLRSAVDSQEAQEDELALYTAMQLVDAMGARLRIELAPTGDACYVVTLPVVEEK
jgi:signal transduction histidine kinase